MAERGGGDRGGFGSGFGGRGDRGGRGGRGDRGRGGRRRAGGRRDEEEKWVPVTKLGRLVKEGKIRSLEQIYLHSLPIKEHQIIDTLVGPTLKDEVMKIMPVQKQTRAGQRTRFKAFVVVGDSNGHVGLGVKCSKEVATAIRGAIILAKLSVIPVRRGYWGNKIIMQVLEDQLMLVPKDQQQIIKGKRTKRQRLPSPLRLAMPGVSNNSYNEGTSYNDNMYKENSKGIEFVKIESCNRSEEEKEEEDMANCLILLAQGHNRHHDHQNQEHVLNHHDYNNNKSSSNFYFYECKTCNRCFPSFQALGGHRASHSKPNKANCNNIVTQQKQEVTTSPFVDDHYDPTMNTILSLQAFTAATPITTITTTATKKSKVHECSICGAEFSSGQALGGHMRRHRTLVSTSTMTTTTTTTPSVSLSIGSRSPKSHEAKKPRINYGLKLDLNLPAPEVDQRDQSKFSFQQPRENVIAFSNSSLVDCHY